VSALHTVAGAMTTRSARASCGASPWHKRVILVAGVKCYLNPFHVETEWTCWPVRIMACYGLDGLGAIPYRVGVFLLPPRPDRF